MMLVSDILELRRSRMLRWAGAGLFALSLHVGGTGLALMQWQEPQESETAGALSVEMMPAERLARVDSPNVAHGPISQLAVPTPPAMQEAEEQVAKEETPPVDSSPAPEPEVALPKPNKVDEEKPQEKPPQEKVVEQQQAQEQATATQDSAPPPVEADAPPGPPPPSSGERAQMARAQASWHKALLTHFDRFKRYPVGARSRGTQGVAKVQFTIDRAGRVLATHIVHGSGSSLLDEEAVDVLQRASPLPAPPPEVAGATIEMTVPVQFYMK